MGGTLHGMFFFLLLNFAELVEKECVCVCVCVRVSEQNFITLLGPETLLGLNVRIMP